MLNFADAFAELPLVAILRGLRPEEAVDVASILLDEGIRIVEVPLNSPDPFVSIARLQALNEGVVSGAGTVLTVAQVDATVAAHGTIIVSPNTDPAVIRHAIGCGAVALPGVASATEAFIALNAGAKMLKLFPAATYGPAHLQALAAVLPGDIVVVPVGGVGPAEMAQWWAAGARGFGLGSHVFRPGMTPAQVRERAATAVRALRALIS